MKRFLPMIASLICGVLIFWQLNIPYSVGLANNGDYVRSMAVDRITFVDDNPNKYNAYVPNYRLIIPSGDNFGDKLLKFIGMDYDVYNYVSSQSLFTKLSKIANVVFNRLTGKEIRNFNLIWLGLLYTIVYSISIYLILKYVYDNYSCKILIFASLIALFVFCDHGYMLYFNSFYGEATQLVITFLALGLILNKKFIMFFVVSILMGMSKGVYAPTGLLFCIAPIFLNPKVWIKIVSIVSIAVLIFVSVKFTPVWIEEDTNYNAVFSGILKLSDTPERELTRLGLNPRYAVLKGTESYQTYYPIDIKSSEFKYEFYGKINKTKLAIYYITHPDKLFKASKLSANMSGKIRPGYLGNLQNPQVPRQQSYRFSNWENLRICLGINNLYITMMFFIGCAFICTRLFKSNRMLSIILALILLSGAINFILPYVCNGIADLAKHMFGFIYFYDLIIFIVLGYLLRAGVDLWTGKRQKTIQ
jgi:hypothetical protein